MCREAIKHFKQLNKPGIIINIASHTAFSGFPTATHYATVKAGIINLTKSIAEEYSKDNIFVYAIAPGAVDTKMFHNILDYKEANQVLENSILIKKLISPQEIANLVVFLAQGNLLHATGSTIDIGSTAYYR